MASERVALPPEHERIVRAALGEWVPDREVWAFGSRVSGKVKPFSDLDLAILGDAPLSSKAREGLLEAFEESDLPFRVDVVEWATLNERFRAVVASHHTLFQEAGRPTLPQEPEQPVP